jgi:uncharacterized protein (DUF433 family)
VAGLWPGYPRLTAEYPGLTHEDLLAAIAYGAEAARERIIPVPAENAV